MKSQQTKTRFPLEILKVLGLIIWAVIPLNLTIILTATQEYMESISSFIPWLLAIIWIVFTGFTVRWMWQYYLKIYPDEMPVLRSRDIGIIFGLFVFLRVVAISGTLLNQSLTGNEMTSNDAALATENPLSISPIYFLIFQLAIGLVAPILEELVFRGIFSNLLFKKESFWLPGIVTSAVFSLLHGFDNLITFSMYFILGFTFFYTYRRRNTIKDSILLHFLNNILAVLLALGTYFYLLIQ